MIKLYGKPEVYDAIRILRADDIYIFKFNKPLYSNIVLSSQVVGLTLSDDIDFIYIKKDKNDTASIYACVGTISADDETKKLESSDQQIICGVTIAFTDMEIQIETNNDTHGITFEINPLGEDKEETE